MNRHTKDNFIGKVFNFGKGDITVKDFSHASKTRVAYFVCTCSVCSLDEQLWPYGSITTTVGALVTRESYPCGCSGKVWWQEFQIKILTERLADQRGYTFLGFEGGF